MAPEWMHHRAYTNNFVQDCFRKLALALGQTGEIQQITLKKKESGWILILN